MKGDLPADMDVLPAVIRAELFAATLGVCVLSLALPLLTLQIYDRILPNPGSGTFPVLIGGLCVALALEMLLRLARARVVAWNGACFEHRAACRAMDSLLGADLCGFGRQGIGAHINGFAAIGRIKDFFSGQSLVTLFELGFLPLYLGFMVYIGGTLVLAPLCVLLVFTAFSLAAGISLRRSLARRDSADDRRYDFLVESLEGIHTLKSFVLEERFQRRYEALEHDSTRRSYDVTADSAGIFNMTTVFSHVMLVVVIASGALRVLEGTLSSGALIAMILLSGRLMQPVQKMVGLWVRYQDFRIAREKLVGIMTLPQISVPADFVKPERRGLLQLRDVAFGYGEGGAHLFRHVNLTVARGEAVRISGAHGAGKTALLHVIAGLSAPAAGDALIDGVPAISYPPSERIRHVALLQTSGVVFHGTIRDNITRFSSVSEAEAREVTGLLGIDRDVSALPRGFDTVLDGTEIDVIPPGLRQRLAIARALASKPRIILFDNADRNLDNEGYRQVYSLLGRLREKVALVIVSDDRNMARLAGRHYVLHEGGLQPQDTADDNLIYGSLRA